MSVVEAALLRGGTGSGSRGSHAYHVVQLALYVHGMVRYAPEMQQLYFGGCLRPQMEVLWVYFMTGNGRSNQIVLGESRVAAVPGKSAGELCMPGAAVCL